MTKELLFVGFTLYFKRPVSMERLARLKERAIALADREGMPVRTDGWSYYTEDYVVPEPALHPLSEFSTVFGDA